MNAQAWMWVAIVAMPIPSLAALVITIRSGGKATRTSRTPTRRLPRCMSSRAITISRLVSFTYEGHQVRTLVIDGNPWFVAADVCAVLDIGNPRQAVSYLDDDEKRVISGDTLAGRSPSTTLPSRGFTR